MSLVEVTCHCGWSVAGDAPTAIKATLAHTDDCPLVVAAEVAPVTS